MVTKKQEPKKTPLEKPIEPRSINLRIPIPTLNTKLILLLLFLVIIIVVIISIVGYLFLSGYFQTLTTITSEIHSSISQCQGTYSYLVTLSSASGPISGQTIYVYANDSLIEKLNTDQNGKISSTKNIDPTWCGKKINFSFNYTGDYFHKTASNTSSFIIRQPSQLIVELANETKVDDPVQLKLKLVKIPNNSLVGNKIIIVSDDIQLNITTSSNDYAKIDLRWNTTGVKTITAYFGGDEFYEGASIVKKSILVSPQNCSDGTIVGSCSLSLKGYYCNKNKTLVFDCTTCGCQAGLLCVENSCITSEQYLNQIINELQESVVLINNSWVQGSGVIISSQNDQTVVLTNRHVVDPFEDYGGASNLKVTTNDHEVISASQVRYAPQGMDLAVIYLPGKHGKEAKINYSQSYLKGDEVIAIGSPYGLFQSVSKGIVSAVRTDSVNTTNYEYSVVQTDAAINPGNSGGGLFLTTTKELIGINSFGVIKSISEGLNFAIDIKEFPKLGDYNSWSILTVKPRCSDGTLYNACSTEYAGYSCVNGYLYSSCSVCGCWGDYPYCGNNGQCIGCKAGSEWSYIYKVCCPYGWNPNPAGCCPPGTYYSNGYCYNQ
jgi:hypothetical protein